jgi:glycosyltransferase involved in cell wall biosynthesis
VGAGELAALYAGAELVALPSFYEGFGLPAIEALSAGAPLVASDLPVLREVAGDAALYAPPDRPDLWAERMGTLLADGDLREELRRKGRERARLFDWGRSAEETARAFWEVGA